MKSVIFRSESGATAIEYAIIGALIGIGLIGSLVGTKTSLAAVFGTAATQMASGTNASSGPLSTAAGSPGVAKLDYASKGRYLTKKTYTGCDLGICGASPESDYTFSDGSSLGYRAPGSYGGLFWFNDSTGSTVRQYYYHSDTGTGSTGDTVYVSGVMNGNSYQDAMTFNADGTVTGTRTTSVNGKDVTSTVPTMQRSDFQNLFNAAAFAKTLI
jgi:Flp pilus assembly pilin Flp